VNGVPPPGTPLTFEWDAGLRMYRCRYRDTETPIGFGEDAGDAYESLLRQIMRKESDR
jgi:hypothetical protein